MHSHRSESFSMSASNPIAILFVCHGNICRSPMAEFVMKSLVADQGLEDRFTIASAAARYDEIGSDTHRGTKRELDKHGIAYTKRAARHIEPEDYETYDYIIGMDQENLRDLMRYYHHDPEHKISLLLDWTGDNRDVADPWYTGNFDTTYDDVMRGCKALLEQIA